MCPSAVSEVEPYASRGARTVPGGGPAVRRAPTRHADTFTIREVRVRLPVSGCPCPAARVLRSLFGPPPRGAVGQPLDGQQAVLRPIAIAARREGRDLAAERSSGGSAPS